MILQALTRHYEDLLRRGDIAAPGMSPAKISFALCIEADGSLSMVIPIEQEVEINKKAVLRPQEMTLPAAVKRASNVASNFLWDNSSYILGVDKKGDPARSLKCFAAAAALHHKVLDNVDSPAAKAVLAFFDNWQPQAAPQHPGLTENGQFDQIISGVNLVFRFNCHYVHEDSAIMAAWQRYQDTDAQNAVRAQCLVTGQADEITAIHPAIKGVRGAQSSGAALVSFNAPAFCSYGHEQNFNAPVGKYAAFAYTAALNHLLADRNSVQLIGSTTVVCWAEDADPVFQKVFNIAAFDQQEAELEYNDIRTVLRKLANDQPCEDIGVDPSRPFYILGLAPNSARLSVRFFLRDTFGSIMKHINAHYERLKIVRPAYISSNILPLGALLRETVNLKSRDKEPNPVMAGAVARAIFTGGPYPASLLQAVMLRIRAESNVTWGRAAILKAYYLRNKPKDFPEEVLTVSLNESCTDIAYTLGRLFSVYEAVQQAANPGINATIKDKYFNSASAMPAGIFPVLNNLYQKHLRKLDTDKRIYYDKQVITLKSILGESYPARMSLAQQGAFDLGYYHQTQMRYTKKEEKDND